MNHQDFNAILDRRIKRCRDTLEAKAGEYATQDRLHNFKQAAHLQQTTTERALLGMMAKHIISVVDLVEMGSLTSRERVDEKITDLINYAILLEAVLEERRAGSDGGLGFA